MASSAQFRQVTGEAGWPDYLQPWVKWDALEYFCNTRLQYEIHGVHVTVETSWNWEAEAGDDTHTACYRGSRAQLELRQGAEEKYRSELYVVPVTDITAALERRIAELQPAYPGIGLAELGREWRVTVSRCVAHRPRSPFRPIGPTLSRPCRASAPAPGMGETQHAREILRVY